MKATDPDIRERLSDAMRAHLQIVLDRLRLANYPLLCTSKAAGDAECERRLDRRTKGD